MRRTPGETGTSPNTRSGTTGGRLPAVALAAVLGGWAPAQAAGTLCADLNDWPFGAAERMVPTVPAVTRPVDFLRRVVADGFPYPPGWRKQIAAEPARPPIYRLLAASALVNKVRFVKEPSDLWKPPRRFLVEGGDCEDFAIAKYALLRDLGYSPADVRMTIARQRGERNLHAIVVVRTGPSPFEIFVLDSRGAGVRTALYCDEFTPLISLNEHAVWAHAAEGESLIASLGAVCTMGP